MAISRNTINVLWGSSYSKVVAPAGVELSERFQFSATSGAAEITIKAVNAGTPVEGDTLHVYLQKQADPDNDSVLDWDNVGTELCVLDTYRGDPAQATVVIPVSAVYGRIRVDNDAGANNITVSAVIAEILST